MSASEKAISAPNLIKSSPIHSTYVYKLHVPLYYSILPTSLQEFLFSKCCSYVLPESMKPSWKKRYMILISKYVYRFESEISPGVKGLPIAVDTMDAQLHTEYPTSLSSCILLDEMIVPKMQSEEYHSLQQQSPPQMNNGGYYFSIRSGGKTRYFCVSSREEARIWIQSLHESKQEYIKRKMGHLQSSSTNLGSDPYKNDVTDILIPPNWEYFDRIGDDLVKRNQRIKEKMDRGVEREFEMSQSGVYSPGGYYS